MKNKWQRYLATCVQRLESRFELLQTMIKPGTHEVLAKVDP